GPFSVSLLRERGERSTRSVACTPLMAGQETFPLPFKTCAHVLITALARSTPHAPASPAGTCLALAGQGPGGGCCARCSRHDPAPAHNLGSRSDTSASRVAWPAGDDTGSTPGRWSAHQYVPVSSQHADTCIRASAQSGTAPSRPPARA